MSVLNSGTGFILYSRWSPTLSPRAEVSYRLTKQASSPENTQLSYSDSCAFVRDTAGPSTQGHNANQALNGRNDQLC